MEFLKKRIMTAALLTLLSVGSVFAGEPPLKWMNNWKKFRDTVSDNFRVITHENFRILE
jgi:hypothetical protein